VGIVFAHALLNYFRASLQGYRFWQALAEQRTHSFGLVHIMLKRFTTPRAERSKLFGIHFVFLKDFCGGCPAPSPGTQMLRGIQPGTGKWVAPRGGACFCSRSKLSTRSKKHGVRR
jgi:hypothetical protein